jgi:hypothetical protein
MDVTKLADVFAQLKSVLSAPANSGSQWSAAKPKARPVGSGLLHDYRIGPLSDFEIVENAEAGKLHALGLGQQRQFGRHDQFICGADVADERYRLECLGGLQLGPVICLGQVLESGWSPLIGQRCLLAAGSQVGRRIRLAYRRDNGSGTELDYVIRKPYTITQHLSTCCWLDREPEFYQKGWLVAIFQ